MTVNDDDLGYTARFKTAFINDVNEQANTKSIEILLITTLLDP